MLCGEKVWVLRPDSSTKNAHGVCASGGQLEHDSHSIALPAPKCFVKPISLSNPNQQLLASKYSGVGGQFFSNESGADSDLFPYVSFTLNIEER